MRGRADCVTMILKRMKLYNVLQNIASQIKHDDQRIKAVVTCT